MLDLYKTTEHFRMATTERMIAKNDKKVHHYLKVMETGDMDPDAETLRLLHEGALSSKDE